MTITNGYITLLEIKEAERLNIPVATTTYDTALEGVIEAVSRNIDNLCSRFFYAESSDVTRYFTAKNANTLLIGSYVSITTLSVATNADRSTYTAWTVDTDYDLYPYDANSDGRPYVEILTAPNSTKAFVPGIGKGVKILGKRGYPAVPKPVKEACILWTMRAYKRYATPLGLSAMTALGEMNMKVPPPDPDVIAMLNPYMDLQIG
jgi:hypothetical protein